MKNLFCFLVALVMATFCFSACKKSSVIRLNEVTHSVFYAPLYLAINLGFMEEEDIQIELTNGGGSDVSMASLLSNNADIALLGPETLVYVAKEGSKNHPIIFGQLTKRDGSFIIGRTPIQNFTIAHMKNKYIIGGREGGMPAMTLEYALNNAGLTHGVNMTYDTSIQFDMITAAFEGGTGDFCTMFEPAASNYVSQGKGYYIASVGELAGEVPFTCFMATADFIKSHPEKIEGFLRAINKAYSWLMTHTPREVAESLLSSFDSTDVTLLESAVKKYIEIDAWCSTPAMTQSSYNRLIQIITNNGIDVSGVSMNDIVNNSFALNLAA